MSQFCDTVIEILVDAPQGLTADQIARILGKANGSINGQLSKLAAYGKIQQIKGERIRSHSHPAVYRLLPNSVSRPSVGEVASCQTTANTN